jgi:hypothetical protein
MGSDVPSDFPQTVIHILEMSIEGILGEASRFGNQGSR